MDTPSVDSFLKTVQRSGLFDAPQIQALRDSAPPEVRNEARPLADHLVKIGKLSRFQAGKLLQGVTLGLALGSFHILAPIGKGGMGAVYLARDIRNQGLVAVKVLPPKRARAQERLLARFRREMEVCTRVSHAHLTRTIEVGVHLGVNYIAMEYIPGQNLYKLINETGPTTVARAARMFAEASLGLAHAHSQGLIHRDLKPSNIIVMPDDHVKVLDLGLALIQGESEAERTIVGGAGYVVGTLDYLAPEQAEDAFRVDSRADIYSLGCTLYFTLIGKAPFPGGNALQKMLRHRCDNPVPVHELNPSIPPTFWPIIERMMAKQAADRFQSAEEVREALLPWSTGAEAFVVGGGTLARTAIHGTPPVGSANGSGGDGIANLSPAPSPFLPVASKANKQIKPDAQAVSAGPMPSPAPANPPAPPSPASAPAPASPPARQLTPAAAIMPAAANGPPPAPRPAAAVAQAPKVAAAVATPPKSAAPLISTARQLERPAAAVSGAPLTKPMPIPPPAAPVFQAVAPKQALPLPSPTSSASANMPTLRPQGLQTLAGGPIQQPASSPRLSSVPVAAPDTVVPMAEELTADTAQEKVPFILDYLMPVGSSLAFLLILWALAMSLLFR